MSCMLRTQLTCYCLATLHRYFCLAISSNGDAGKDNRMSTTVDKSSSKQASFTGEAVWYHLVILSLPQNVNAAHFPAAFVTSSSESG